MSSENNNYSNVLPSLFHENGNENENEMKVFLKDMERYTKKLNIILIKNLIKY